MTRGLASLGPALGGKTGKRRAAMVLTWLVVILAAGWMVHTSEVTRRHDLQQTYWSQAETTARFVQSFTSNQLSREASLAEVQLQGAVSLSDFQRLVEDNGFQAAVLVDGQGRLLADFPAKAALLGTDISPKYPHLRSALTGVPTVSGVVLSAVQHQPVVAFAAPFNSPSGRRVLSGGYLVSDTPLRSYLINEVTQAPGVMYLVDSTGSVVASSNPDFVQSGLLSHIDAQLAGAATQPGARTTGTGRAQREVVTVGVVGTPWRLVAAEPTRLLYQPLNGFDIWAPRIGLLLLALVGLAAVGLLERTMWQRSRLGEQQNRSQAILDSAVDGFMGMDQSGLITDWNPAAVEMFGWTAEQSVGRSLAELVLAEGQRAEGVDRLQQTVRSVRGPVTADRVEVLAVRQDGREFPVEVSVSRARLTQGWRFYGFVRDIGPRRASEAKMRTLSQIVESAGDAIYSRDLGGHITSWNASAEKLFGWTAGEMLGQDLSHAMVPASEMDDMSSMIDVVAGTKTVRRVETRRLNSCGERVDVALTLAPLFDEVGAVTGVSVSARDVGERQRFEEQLRQNAIALAHGRDEAVAATRAKSTFLATMSHEIRTPMNAVIGMTGLLLDTDLDAMQRDYTETVRGSGEALLGIINDILDYSKIESGQLELDLQPFDVCDLVEGALDVVAVPADAKRLDVIADINPDCPPTLMGDVTRLRQVLVNLLSNAVKFTSSGEVLVSVDAQAAADGQLTFRIAVTDTGIGIPADRMDRLFRSFSQVEASTTRTYGGTGLGLAISSRLVEAMGGTIEVESEAGRGSTFRFAVPTARFDTPGPRSAPAPEALQGRHLLVVDDNANNRRIVQRQLEGWGATSDAAHDGAEALRLAALSGDYDAAVLDLHMPDMDGIELAVKLHALAGRAHLPLVLLSSRTWPNESADAGQFAERLTKPIRSVQLRRALTRAVGAMLPEPANDPSPTLLDEAELPPSRRYLLAEDNTVNQKVALLMLRRLGHQADVARNGIEAVAAVHGADYDVVFMDVQMPEMDGLEATRRIRADHTILHQPVIIAMTANAMTGDRAQCIEAGMDDYLAKPFRMEELQAALARLQPV